MGILDEREYRPECSMSDLPLDDYFNKTKTHGHFTEDGTTYVLERRDTPRPWLQFLANDKIHACVDNQGGGYFWHTRGYWITKQWERPWYYTHDPSGKRTILIEADGKTYNFFDEAENLLEYVSVGSVKFTGTLGELRVTVELFVPASKPCECWHIHIENTGAPKQLRVTVGQDWLFRYYAKYDETPAAVTLGDGVIWARKDRMVGNFAVSGSDITAKTDKAIEEDFYGQKLEITYARLTQTVAVDTAADLYVTAGASADEAEVADVLPCATAEGYAAEFAAMQAYWDGLLSRNRCEVPDKNLERFLNYWLKNQTQLTYYYDRGNIFTGFRDSLQDAWGYMLMDPQEAKNKFLRTLAHLMTDGRGIWQYYRWENKDHDMRDCCDSIVYAADTLATYIKETGDTAIMEEMIPFLDSEEKTTVEDHILRGFDSLYRLRGTNGLCLMRDGDWLDGLEYINKYGDDATSVWVTIGAFYGQNVLADLFDYLGKADTAAMLRARSAEYKEIVNRVGWDGNWYVYAFHADGEPIGGAENLEGKIHANVQTWAIFSGIADPDKVRRIEKSMNRYLQTPFGPMLFYPPYVFHGERAGRLQRQRPGTFANGAVYNHAAAFKVFADVARGDYDDALDTFQRAIPNHPDNSDMCRTGEPYAVGNVYYGINHPRFGMNLFTWWTATCAWLLYAGFEKILGVQAGYDGLVLEPHVPVEWDTYRVDKLYRDTMYHITFVRDEDKGVWVDGEKQADNKVKSTNKACTVLVKF